MRTHILAGLAIVASSLVLTPAIAASSKASHGVRVHKLMQPQKSDAAQHLTTKDSHNPVPPHKHRIVLKRGQRVVVRIFDGFGRSRYRKRHPGVNRPWQDRRYGSDRRLFMNPKGLYTSKLYRPGYY